MSKLFNINSLEFGDKLITKNGMMAVYLKQDSDDGHLLIAINHMPNNCFLSHYEIKNDILIEAHARLNDDFDIIGYWEDFLWIRN